MYKRILLAALFTLVLSQISFSQDAYKDAESKFRIKDFDAVVNITQKIIKKDKKNAKAYNLQGLAYLGLEEYRKARKAFSKATKLEPIIEFKHNLAFANLKTGDFRKAKRLASEIIAEDKDYSSAYYLRSAASIKKFKFDEAISDLNEALRIEPTSLFYRIKKSNAYLLKYALMIHSKTRNESREKSGILELEKAIEVLESCNSECLSQDNNGQLDRMKFAIRTLAIRREARLEANGIQSKESYKEILARKLPGYISLDLTLGPYAKLTRESRSRRIEGTVILLVYFRADSEFYVIGVAKGSPVDLTISARYTLSKSTFEPAKLNGKPVDSILAIGFAYGF